MLLKRPQPHHRVYSQRRAHCVKGKALTDTAMTQCKGRQGTWEISLRLSPTSRARSLASPLIPPPHSPPHTHALTHAQLHTHTLTHNHAYVSSYNHMHTHTHAFIHMHLHTHAYSHMLVHMHTLTYSHTHTYTHSHLTSLSVRLNGPLKCLWTPQPSLPQANTTCWQTSMFFTWPRLTGSLRSTLQPAARGSFMECKSHL